MHNAVTIGCGSAYADDWLDPGAALADSGRVQYMVFDCLAERTMALAHVRRLQNPATGQDQRIQEVVTRFAGFMRAGGKIIGSFGAANPSAGGEELIAGLRKEGLDNTRVGILHGDDVLAQALELDLDLPQLGMRMSKVGVPIVSANAYVGAEGIVPLLEADCSFILGGRIADPSPYVAVLSHELGWALDDWRSMGTATLVGHLLECGIHGCGGNFNDPPYRNVPDVHDVGVPMAEVSSDGDVVITKLDSCGGAINEQVVKTQLLYEIHDPAAYLTPDVTADFSRTTVQELGHNRVRVSGASGRAQPETLKVLVGLDLGWKVVGEASYGGTGALDRARHAQGVLRRRLERYAPDIDELRLDMHGVNALSGEPNATAGYELPDVRLRLAARCRTLESAQAVAHESEFMYFATAGAGGVTHSVVPAIGVTAAYIPRSHVQLHTEVLSV